MTDQLPRRKRSASARLTAAGALAMLSACEAAPDNEQMSREKYGPPVTVSAFQTLQQCVESGEFDRDTCNRAQEASWKEDGKAAPRYADRTLCEEQFGHGQCLQRSDGGQSFFTPLLAGFMISRLLDSSLDRYRYGGLYRDEREDVYYTGSGAWLYNTGYGGRPHGYQVGSRGVTTPVTTQRIQTRSSVVSRGGFGGRVSMRSGGGWGGGRSFGG